jgi:hypothetical protein
VNDKRRTEALRTVTLCYVPWKFDLACLPTAGMRKRRRSGASR